MTGTIPEGWEAATQTSPSSSLGGDGAIAPIRSHAGAAPPVLLTIREASAAMALSVRTLQELVARGELAVVRIGRTVRFRRADLEELADRHAATRPTVAGRVRTPWPGRYPAPVNIVRSRPRRGGRRS